MSQQPTEEKKYPAQVSATFAGTTLLAALPFEVLAHLGPTGLLVGGLASYVAWKHGPELYDMARDTLTFLPALESGGQGEVEQPASAKQGRSFWDRALGVYPEQDEQAQEETGQAEPREAEPETGVSESASERDTTARAQARSTIPAQFRLARHTLEAIQDINSKRFVYFGQTATRQVVIPIRTMYHVLDVASSGKGKSNRFRPAMMQTVEMCETYFINPLANNVKAVDDARKIEGWKPCFDRLANKKPVKDGPDILRLMTALVVEIESRNTLESTGDFSWRERPLFVFIDELPEVFARCPQAVELLDKIGRTGRQFCVFCWVASQTAQVKDIGLSTASQAQFKTRIYGGGDKTSSDRVMKGSIAKEDEKTLQTNGAGLTLLLADGFSDQAFVRAPLITNEALFAYFGLPPFQIEEWIAPAKTVSRQPVAASKGRAQEDDPLAENYINADTDLVDDDPLEPYTPVTRNATGVAEALSDDFEHSSNVRVTRNATLPAGWTEKDVELATLIYKNLRNKDQCLKAIGKATSQDNRRVLSSILQEEE